MKKKLLILITWMFIASTSVFATEGMWVVAMLNKINEAEMHNLGLKLSKEDIYNINKASLKDAIVRFGAGFCTGEIVSNQGLIFTNHHCAYDAIQSSSTLENNILKNGFCAKSFSEEIPIPGLTLSLLVRVEDVTAEINAKLNDGMTEAERSKTISAAQKDIVARINEAEKGNYNAEVKVFYGGNEFYLFIYQTYRDIRLVGNPPESVGKFGGDTDNWMWPRHTGDFSMLRIYAGANNLPADYNKENKPYSPKHFFPVNLGGVKDGDFAMIMGYPARTSRYLTSYGVEQAIDVQNPILVECLGLKLETWKKNMDANEGTRLMYAAKYASTANSWKYYIGQTRGLKRLDVAGKKTEVEEAFTKWMSGNESAKAKYGTALPQLKEYYTATNEIQRKALYARLAGNGAEFLSLASSINGGLEKYFAESDESKKQEILKSLRDEAEVFYVEFNVNTDHDVFVALINLYRSRINAEDRPSWHSDLLDKEYGSDVSLLANSLFGNSVLMNKNQLLRFLSNPTQEVASKDLALIIAKSNASHMAPMDALFPREKMSKGQRLFIAGLREMNPKKQYAPDANSTMRITYGKVRDYQAADAVRYNFYTTSKGILEKKDNSNPEFEVPDALAKKLENKEFGRYANKKGELVTCFIADLDITGGNSGSPTLDAKGNIIGIAFDGNWEAMSGDIAYEPALQRTIVVDIRYVLFIVEELMGGKNIIEELKFVNVK
ncbi:MAG: S46 family peptidase [Bacteroidetes bacterium]|nr:S46 family peptidase [Bacteroidota bacterium]